MITFSKQTCARAWLAAALHLQKQPDNRDYNVILSIQKPMLLSEEDRALHDKVDGFLNTAAETSISTVINTIFPASLYIKYGRSGVLEKYNEAWPRIQQHPDVRWGTYARRMLYRERCDGTTFNPLELLINKLSRQGGASNPKRATYEINLADGFLEIPIYDDSKDAGPIMGTPCLSHLSFKLGKGNQLMLTAFYRSHYYIERALGNLFGLAWLQHFVAAEAHIVPGELVCISSMAQLETGSSKRNRKGWHKRDIDALLSSLSAVDQIA